MAPAQASLLAKLDTQERVRDFLTNAVAVSYTHLDVYKRQPYGRA